MIQQSGPSPPVALVILILVTLALYPVATQLTGEGRDTASNDSQHPKVLLIGLDAADWVMLDHWFDRGELPHLARLSATGLRGDSRTLRPIISPLVWTSISTGQTPDRHGVTDFFAARDGEQGLQAVTRQAVLAPTMWEILSERGLSVATTAWWASWPADHSLNGRVITDQVQFAFPGPVESAAAASPDSLYHPPALAQQLEHCLVHPRMLDAGAVSAFAPCTPADLLPGASDPAPALLRRTLAATSTYYRMTRQLLRDEQPDFAAIYFLGTDTVAHLYSQSWKADSQNPTLLRFYRLVDAMVGDLCSQVDPMTMVVLASDHGFYTGDDRPAGDSADFRHQAASWHRPLGIVLINAPWIKPGRLADASVLDIAPTLLWQLLGERFETLPGRVLAEQRLPTAGTSRISARHSVPAGSNATGEPAGSPPDRLLEQLRALGYLGDETTVGAQAVRPVIHLADYLQWADRPADALEQLTKARDRLGESPDLLVRLAAQLSRAGDRQGAMETLRAALDRGWNPGAAGRLAMAVGIFCAAAQPEQAEALLDAFAPQPDRSPDALTARAVLAGHRGLRQEALDGYAAALEADPASGHAAQRICRLLTDGDSRLQQLCIRVRQAADLRTGDAQVQLNAGRLLLATGDPEAALKPLNRAVYLEPDLADPRLLLGRALYLSGRPAEACERLARGLAWHPSHSGLLAAAGAAAIRAGYASRGAALLERAAEAGAAGPQIEAALEQARRQRDR